MPEYSRYVDPKEAPPVRSKPPAPAPPEKKPSQAKSKKTIKGVKDDAE